MATLKEGEGLGIYTHTNTSTIWKDNNVNTGGSGHNQNNTRETIFVSKCNQNIVRVIYCYMAKEESIL